MYLSQSVQTDLSILPGANKLDHLLQRTVQLSYYILYRQHHTERQLPPDHAGSSDDGDDDVLRLIDGGAPRLLPLPDPQGAHLHPEELCLNLGPPPPPLQLTALELDLRHALYDLDQRVLGRGVLLEGAVVDFLTQMKEEGDPAKVQYGGP